MAENVEISQMQSLLQNSDDAVSPRDGSARRRDVVHKSAAVLQNHVEEIRGHKQRWFIFLRRFVDSFLIHASVIVLSFIQLCFYLCGSENTITAVINVVLFIHLSVDIAVLIFIHFIFIPKAQRSTFQEGCCSVTECDFFHPRDHADQNDAKPLCHQQSTTRGPSPVSPSRRSFPAAAVFDIACSCVAIISSLGHVRSHPLFLFRCMGYAFNHTRLATSLRVLVGLNKRFLDDGEFLLDLTYITDRVIAMALPGEQCETLYRNPIDQVSSYMRYNHRESHMVINTCAERVYNKAYFDKVLLFPCQDHEIMPLHRILTFCDLARDFLSSDPDSVIAVHCMGGKGRTGLMIASWLLYSRFCKTTEAALRVYGSRRTDNLLPGKSVTISNPCQIRFVRYVEEICRFPGQCLLPPTRLLRIRRVIVYINKKGSASRGLAAMVDDMVIRLTGLHPPPRTRSKFFQSSSNQDAWDFVDPTGDSSSSPRESDARSLLEGSNATLLQDLETPYSSYLCGNVVHTEHKFVEPTTGQHRHVKILDWRSSPASAMEVNDETSAAFVPARDLINRVRLSAAAADQRSDDDPDGVEGNTAKDGYQNLQDEGTELRAALWKGVEIPVIADDFGFEIMQLKRARPWASEAQKNRPFLEYQGRIWLNANFLHLKLPPYQSLQEIWNRQPHKIVNRDNDKFVHYQEERLNGDKVGQEQQRQRIVVGYQWNDVDFRSRSIRNKLKDVDFLMIAVFDVIK